MLVRGLGFALIGGLIGAVAWGAIAYVTGWSFSIVAIMVGLLCGCGMGYGLKGRGSVATGVLSSIIALGCIVGAKFVVAVIEARDWAEEVRKVSEEDAIDAYASEVYDYYVATGQHMTYLDDDDWPLEVQEEAERLWSETPEHEREEYLAAMARDADQEASDGRLGASVLIFGLSFIRPVQWLILGVAMTTAYKAGRRNIGEEAEAALGGPLDVVGVPEASDGSDRGITAGPLSRAHHGSASAPAPVVKSKKKKKGQDDDEADPHGAGIFTRLGNANDPPPSTMTMAERAAKAEEEAQQAAGQAAGQPARSEHREAA